MMNSFITTSQFYLASTHGSETHRDEDTWAIKLMDYSGLVPGHKIA